MPHLLRHLALWMETPHQVRGSSPTLTPPASGRGIHVSVKTGAGIEAFMQALEARILSTQPPESSFITRARHRAHLSRALEHLHRYASQGAAGLELKSEELRRAATEIGKITGKIEVDELLGHIFSSFCIGK